VSHLILYGLSCGDKEAISLSPQVIHIIQILALRKGISSFDLLYICRQVAANPKTVVIITSTGMVVKSKTFFWSLASYLGKIENKNAFNTES
jgi:hypothetical protein